MSMKLKYGCLVCATITEISVLSSFVSDYGDAVSVQIDFKDEEIELFDKEGHLVAHRDFEDLF